MSVSRDHWPTECLQSAIVSVWSVVSGQCPSATRWIVDRLRVVPSRYRRYDYIGLPLSFDVVRRKALLFRPMSAHGPEHTNFLINNRGPRDSHLLASRFPAAAHALWFHILQCIINIKPISHFDTVRRADFMHGTCRMWDFSIKAAHFFGSSASAQLTAPIHNYVDRKFAGIECWSRVSGRLYAIVFHAWFLGSPRKPKMNHWWVEVNRLKRN
jgi:hypothetical protein